MTKFTLVMTVCGVLATAGCMGSNTKEAPIVRNGPQTQSPIADAPGGKLPNGGTVATQVIIDDSAPMVTAAPMRTVAAAPVTTVASSPALAQTSASIFEFIR